MVVDRLPEGLAELPPGPALAVALSKVDRYRLGGADTIALLGARARQVAYDHAQLLADLAEAAITDWHTVAGVHARMNEPDEFSLDRIGWALNWARPTARYHLELATDLLRRLPAVHAALRAGRIDLARAKVFHEALVDLDDTIAETVVARLIEPAARLTCTRLRSRLRYHVHKADPDRAARRAAKALAQRRVAAAVTSAGTAHLAGHDLPVDRVAAADDHLNRLARAAKAQGDSRSLRQLRADAYLDLLTGIAFGTAPTCDPITGGPGTDATEARSSATDEEPADATTAADDQTGRHARLDTRTCCKCGGVRPANRRGVITITMTLATLIGLNDHPAVIPGWGPVLADVARRVALDQAGRPSWQYAVTDDDGNLLYDGYTRRRPDAQALRRTKLRDRTCRAPNCDRPATTCDTDHRRDWARGGGSGPENLGTLCRHHHRLKHAKQLTLEHLGHGAHRWTTPGGETYEVPADKTALLTADEAIQPATYEARRPE